MGYPFTDGDDQREDYANFEVGGKYALMFGSEIPLKHVPIVKNKALYLSTETFASFYNLEFKWDSKTQTVSIKKPEDTTKK